MPAFRDLFATPEDYRDHLQALQDLQPAGRSPKDQASSREADMIDLLRKEWESRQPVRKLSSIFNL